MNNEDTMRTQNNNSGNNGTSAALGAISGALGGAAAAAGGIVLMSHHPAPETPEQNQGVDVPQEPTQETPTNSTPSTHHTWSVDAEVPVATHVNDDMSFSQAFAAARAEVGPGGCFEWHGGVYGTYYENEWNNMTPAERAEYENHFSWNKHHDNYANNHNDHHQEAHVADNIVSDDHGHHYDHDVTAVPVDDDVTVEADARMDVEGVNDNYANEVVVEDVADDVQIIGFDSEGMSDDAVFIDNDDVIYVDLSSDQSDFEMMMPMGDSGEMLDSDIIPEQDMSFDADAPETFLADGDTNPVDDFYA